MRRKKYRWEKQKVSSKNKTAITHKFPNFNI